MSLIASRINSLMKIRFVMNVHLNRLDFKLYKMDRKKLAEEMERAYGRNELYCTMCQYTMQFLDMELKKNATEQAMLQALEVVCKVAPASTQKECEAMINTYGIYLIELLIQFADPLKVCEAIKLC